MRGARIAQLREIQDAVEERIGRLGGRVVGRLWIANQLIVEAPGPSVGPILGLPGVVSGFEVGSLQVGVGYTGHDVRSGTLVGDFFGASYRGNSHSRNGASERIRIAVSEVGRLNVAHVGFQDYYGGPSRIARYALCAGGACSNQTQLPVAGDSHPTFVVSAALGSIEESQDINFFGFQTLQQGERSGINPEARIYYYQSSGAADLPTAVQQAVWDGADVYSGSWTISCGPNTCHPLGNCLNLDTIFRNGMDAGMLSVMMVGNGASQGGSCTLSWPGYSPFTIGVSALDSVSGTNYGSLPRASFAGYGPLVGRLYDGTPAPMPGVDIAAPGVVRHLYRETGLNVYESSDVGGTSISTPIVAGAAGLLRQSMNAIGWSGNNSRALAVNLLLLGDHSDGTASGLSQNFNPLVGSGRLRMHWPANASMVAPWGWGWRSFTIHDGQTVTWTVGDAGAESNSITSWKWAFMWFENSLDSAADIVIDVVDSCAGNISYGGDYSFSTRKSLRLTAAQIGGRCLVMRATGYNVPPEGRVVYSADYFHSGDPSLH